MADRAAANKLLGRVVDPAAHGNHAVDPRTERVTCGNRRYLDGYAPCQISGRWNVRPPEGYADTMGESIDVTDVVGSFMPNGPYDRTLRLNSSGEWVDVKMEAQQ